MTKHIQNKTIIITGASQGIGEAAAVHLATNGANIVLVARNKTKLDNIASHIKSLGGNALALAGDVSKFETLEHAINLAKETFGKVDILVNNAGIIDPISKLADSDVEAWSNVVDINYKGVYYGLRAAIPHMLEHSGGTIINISSGAATSPLEGWSHYCSSKAAVLMLTKCAHKEYNDQGIRVIGLSPGTVATDMQTSIKTSGINPVSQLDWSKHIPAKWVALAISYLISDDADDLSGTDFSIKTDEGRSRVGLPLIGLS